MTPLLYHTGSWASPWRFKWLADIAVTILAPWAAEPGTAPQRWTGWQLLLDLPDSIHGAPVGRRCGCPGSTAPPCLPILPAPNTHSLAARGTGPRPSSRRQSPG